jgi:hypothetical protein
MKIYGKTKWVYIIQSHKKEFFFAKDNMGKIIFGGFDNAGGVDGTDAHAVIKAAVDSIEEIIWVD